MKMMARIFCIFVLLTQLSFAKGMDARFDEYRRSHDSGKIEWMQVESYILPDSIGIASKTGDALWEEKNNGLYGAEGLAIAVNSQGHLFLGTGSGVLYRSINNGDMWEVANSSFLTGIETLAIDLNDNIYLENAGALHRSTDGGTSFSEVGLLGIQINEIVSGTNQILYAATDDGVYKSTDSGENWTAYSFTGSVVRTIAVSPDSVLLAATNTGIHESGDGGATWMQLTDSLLDVTAIAFNSSKHVFVTTASNGVYRSTDGGTVWMQKIEGLPHDPFPLLFLADIVVDNDDNLFICTSTQLLYSSTGEGHGGIYRSTDNAENWQRTDVIMTFVHALATNSSGHVFSATRGFGAYRSTDNGVSWTAISTGLKNLTVNAMVSNSNGIVFAATQGAGVYRSLDNGETWTSAWTLITGSVSVGYIKSLTIDTQGNLFAGANIAGMYRSTDNGQSWVHLDPFQVGLGGVGVNALITNSQNHIFAGVNIMGVFGSKDNGNSWEQLLDTTINVHMFALNSQEHVLAGSNSAGLFFSDDTGRTWIGVMIPGNVIVSTIAFNAADELSAGFLSQFPNVAGIYRQSKPGQAWEQLLANFLTPPPFRGGNGIAINPSGAIFAGGSTGAAKSIDNGDNWLPYNDGLPNASSGHINADIYTVVFGPQDFLYAGIRNNGVFRSADPIVSFGSQVFTGIPTEYILFQNYPNPFNPSTTIGFQIPSAQFVTLKIYNILGEEVATLIEKEMSTGQHEVIFNAANLAGGTYFLKLQAADFTEIKKMTFVK